MSKFVYIYVCLLLLMAALSLASCMDNDFEKEVDNFSVTVLMPEGLKEGVSYANQLVILTLNADSKKQYTATTDANGVAYFANIIPEVYNISTSWQIAASDYAQMVDEEVENKDVVISAAATAQTITKEVGNISIEGSLSVKQSILISKYFYAARKNASSKNYLADRFIELFNNSDEDVALDGLYIALLESESSNGYFAHEHQDTVYAKQVFRIPGSGSENMLAPGATCLIASASATDHTENLGYDLTGADFEPKNNNYTNNIDVPALELYYSFSATLLYMNFLNSGPTALVIFRTEEDINEWELVYPYGKTSGSQYKAIPASTIIDGVESLKYVATGVDADTKRLYNFIDAGYQFATAATGYTGEVMVRKTASYENGRYYLVDTNNSSEDFVVTTDIEPRAFLEPETTETE